jgi:hypothetical protein
VSPDLEESIAQMNTALPAAPTALRLLSPLISTRSFVASEIAAGVQWIDWAEAKFAKKNRNKSKPLM